MDIKVTTKFLRISPRKLRPVVNSVRGKNLVEAKNILTFQNKKGSKILLSSVNSAMAIARENDVKIDELFIKTLACDEGPRLKRSKPGSKGSVQPIQKRMSHIRLIVAEFESKPAKVAKKAKTEVTEAKTDKKVKKVKNEEAVKGSKE